MKQKKDIDRLYREKFQNKETPPPAAVWENISSRLPEKEEKRKRILPLWYKLAGVAALVALLFTIGDGFFESSQNPIAPVETVVRPDFRDGMDRVDSEFRETMYKSSRLLNGLLATSAEMSRAEMAQAKTASGTEFRSSENAFSGNISDRENQPATANEQQPSGIAGEVTQQPENLKNSEGSEEPEENTSLAAVEPLPEQEKPENPFEPENIEKNANNSRLSVSTKIAPVYYDQMGNGSSIDQQFTQNQSSGEVSLSYGINLAYQISEKVKLRSGVNKVSLNYNTQRVGLTAAVNSVALGGEGGMVALASPITGSLNQKLGFVEVPLEVEYALVNKKVGVNLIAGASTFFLDGNAVYLEASNQVTKLGEAQNLNDLSFSSNIGLGFDYELLDNFQINLEPMVKFQINTFENTQNVSPYYFGIYTGFSYEF